MLRAGLESRGKTGEKSHHAGMATSSGRMEGTQAAPPPQASAGVSDSVYRQTRAIPWLTGKWGQKCYRNKPGVVAHAYNPSNLGD